MGKLSLNKAKALLQENQPAVAKSKRVPTVFKLDPSRDYIMEDTFPIHAGYLYLCDNVITESNIAGTVARLKLAHKCSEVRAYAMFAPGREKARLNDRVEP